MQPKWIERRPILTVCKNLPMYDLDSTLALSVCGLCRDPLSPEMMNGVYSGNPDRSQSPVR